MPEAPLIESMHAAGDRPHGALGCVVPDRGREVGPALSPIPGRDRTRIAADVQRRRSASLDILSAFRPPCLLSEAAAAGRAGDAAARRKAHGGTHFGVFSRTGRENGTENVRIVGRMPPRMPLRWGLPPIGAGSGPREQN
jgi:hypothetical protein